MFLLASWCSLEAIEVVAHGDEKAQKVVGKRIEVDLPEGATIGAIYRESDEEKEKRVVIAHDDTVIENGDHLIVFLVDKRYTKRGRKDCSKWAFHSFSHVNAQQKALKHAFCYCFRILGLLLMLFSLTLIPPIFVSLIYHDAALSAFLFSFLTIFLIGVAVWFPVT